ncbi:phosphodiester glycosidase family protein [Prosthecobacter sp.]|uniref:phosphodiester glycosidase family protein n=1 Tax=Prosthecobacter sp. TaxID=1965333 RepID=UPI0037840E82
MRHLAFIAALALASCAQPPAPHHPQPQDDLASQSPQAQPQQPDLAPRYPSWDEVRAHAQPLAASPESSSHGKELVGGASLIDETLHLNGRSIAVQYVLFDSRSYALQVIDQPVDWSGGGKISECMRSVNAAAGVNGGFFTPQFAPMGLMIASSHKIGAWQSNKLLSGAVVVHHQPRLLWNAEVQGNSDAQHLIQAGPRLVDAGHAVPNLERRKQTTRTFIATDGGHRWIMGIAHSTSLGELADALASAPFPDGFRIHRALNLDGGHSSALYYRTSDGHEHAHPGWSTVRNYIGIVPR